MTTTPTATTHRFELVFDSAAGTITHTSRYELSIPESKLTDFTYALLELLGERDLGVEITSREDTRTDGGNDYQDDDDDDLENMICFSHITSFRRLPTVEGQ